ncbi:Amidohydro-rel domain-containing protein [Mycena indigotica]|uniref:Amidohydro-rel domain-containing protein n=1 Tax=Mycena indigotica TaxID=2126181 RepID=A0A8H6W0U1_9AGAR|nr:Amidohydro-rel domain-containing protein [Mycena indigotica]KAF7298876.1 Amidohydro-rel domain-containing protein [Mycena indigotica]
MHAFRYLKMISFLSHVSVCNLTQTTMQRNLRIRGNFVQTPELGDLGILRDHLLVTDDKGVIVIFEPASSQSELTSCFTLPRGQFIMPTFVDTHLHAPQFLYQGNGLHLPLMQWLDEYAFRAEERLDGDPQLARKVYAQLARRLIQFGTSTVLLFGTIKEETNLILADAMKTAGLRAFVGKLSMDMLSKPSYIEPSADASIRAAQSFAEKCMAMNSSSHPHEHLLEPVLTPRFVPTCSDELLSGLGGLAAQHNLKIQSHLAEALDQVDFVRKQRGAEDIDIFDQYGLLTPRTVQAHCTFLNAPSLTRLSNRGTAIAHCPLSNSYFSAEPFPLREALDAGVKVGLGTDIAGGYALDIMNAMRHAVSVSRIREGNHQVAEREQQEETKQSLAINWIEALYLATKGGAQALGLKTGAFTIGAPFDAQQIQLLDSEGNGVGALDFFDLEDGGLTMEMIEKWWCVGERGNRIGIYDEIITSRPQYMTVSISNTIPEQNRGEPWYEDGNIILMNNDTAFKAGCLTFSGRFLRLCQVFKGMIAQHSPVLRQRIQVEAASVELIEGCPAIVLDDSTADLAHFLDVIHGCERAFRLATKNDFLNLVGILRIATKYDAKMLRQRALQPLKKVYPSTLPQWDDAFESNSLLWVLDAVTTINMAREFDALSILPAAFVFLANSTMAREAFGVSIFQTQPLRFAPGLMRAEDVKVLTLMKEYNQHSIARTLRFLRDQGKERHSLCQRSLESACCSSKFTGMFIALSVLVATAEAPVGYPTFVVRVHEVINREDFCRSCRDRVEAGLDRRRRAWWRGVPEAIGFGGWDDERLI